MQDGIQSLYVKVNGRRAHYLNAGSGPPIVLLHGGASDATDWVETLGALSLHYSLYAPDMFGYGYSDHVKSVYHLRDFVDFVRGFIQTLKLDSPVLVGHSLGGRVSLEIAFNSPEMVNNLVLINTAGFGNITRLGNWLGTLLWRMRDLFGRPQPYPPFLPEEGEEPGWLCLEQLPDLHKPTLIVWKHYDLYFPLASAIKAKELIPEARLAVFPGYGHAPHRENRRAFNNLLVSFLNGEQLLV